MTGYRIFFFDVNDHIRHAKIIECEGDEDAVRLAADQADGRVMELWLLDCLVKRFPTNSPAQRG